MSRRRPKFGQRKLEVLPGGSAIVRNVHERVKPRADEVADEAAFLRRLHEEGVLRVGDHVQVEYRQGEIYEAVILRGAGSDHHEVTHLVEVSSVEPTT